MVTDVDLLIVGAGPTGLYAAYYAGFRGMRVAIVDSLTEPGGQLMALYPEKPIYDVAGYPSVLARDLALRLVEQASAGDPTYLLGRRAQGLTRREDGTLLVDLDGDDQVHAKAIIISAGIGTFTPRALPGGEAYVGQGLRYVRPGPGQFLERTVLVPAPGSAVQPLAVAGPLLQRPGPTLRDGRPSHREVEQRRGGRAP